MNNLPLSSNSNFIISGLAATNNSREEEIMSYFGADSAQQTVQQTTLVEPTLQPKPAQLKPSQPKALRIPKRISAEQLELGLDNQQINFKHHHLNGLDLMQMDFRQANLNHSTLVATNLRQANLDNTSLKYCNLSHAVLAQASGKKLNLHRARLNDANLADTILTDAILTKAILNCTELVRADLSRANLSGAQILASSFICANLQAAVLRASKINGALFNEAYLSHTILENAHIRNANFEFADLSNANLTNARLINVKLTGANLTNANLTNCTITLDLMAYDPSDEEELDAHFNHIENGGSLLSAINSIDPKFNPLKIRLMNQVISWLSMSEAELHFIADPLNDILFSDLCYISNKTIRDFIRDNLATDIIDKGNLDLLHNLNHVSIAYFSHYIRNLSPHGQKNFMRLKNNFFNQLLFHLHDSEMPAMHELANWFTNTYLGLPEVKAIKEQDIYNEYQYILLQNPHALMISHNYFSGVVNDTLSAQQWSHLAYFKNNPAPDTGQINYLNQILPNNLTDLYNIFKIFSNTYKLHAEHSNFIKLINLLNLSDNYRGHFLAAAQVKNYPHKLVNPQNNLELALIFNPYLDQQSHTDRRQIRLTAVHANEIITVYTYQTKSEEEQAKLFYTLATLFTHYSSANSFGTHEDSPEVIRYYSLALLNQATQLNPDLITSAKLTLWHNKLTGYNDSFSCTEVLAFDMLLLNNRTSIIPGIIPPAMLA